MGRVGALQEPLQRVCYACEYQTCNQQQYDCDCFDVVQAQTGQILMQEDEQQQAPPASNKPQDYNDTSI